MILKKSKKADIERSRGVFLQTGLVVGLSLTLIAFDWKSSPVPGIQDNYYHEISFEPEVIVSTFREPKPEIIIPRITEILKIVPNEVNIDDIIKFDPEINGESSIDYSGIDNMPEKFIDDPTFITVEDMPLFNGGKPEKEFLKYIIQNVKYPGIAADNGVKGRVLVQFVVNAKGKVVDAVVLLPVDPALDKEALRVITSSPDWTPGKQRGKPVKVLYTFPINFVLQ